MEEKSCSFCEKSQSATNLLIEKPGVLICEECVREFDERFRDPSYGEPTEPHRDCSFCSFMKNMPAAFLASMLPNQKGRRLIRGAKFSICDDCLDVCVEIVSEEGRG